jgi:hypothetical protein
MKIISDKMFNIAYSDSNYIIQITKLNDDACSQDIVDFLELIQKVDIVLFCEVARRGFDNLLLNS